MEFNPFYSRIAPLESQRKTVQAQLNTLRMKLASHDPESVNEVRRSIQADQVRIRELLEEITAVQAEVAQLDKGISSGAKTRDKAASTLAAVGGPTLVKLGGAAWILGSMPLLGAGVYAYCQWTAIAEGKRHRSLLIATQQRLLAEATELQARCEEAVTSAPMKFDREEATRRLQEIEDSLEGVVTEIQTLTHKRDELDQQLGSLPSLIMADRARKHELEQLHPQLKDLSRQLSQLKGSENSRLRAAIHERCHELMGSSKDKEDYESDARYRIAGNPKEQAQGTVAAIKRVEDGLGKKIERALELRQIAEIPVRSLIIDGSNLCSEPSRKFVGLGPVLAALQWLADHRPDCSRHVVFDPGVLGKLTGYESALLGRKVAHFKESDLRARIGTLATVNVTEKKADKIFLCAAHDPNSYVISNDRFRDFPDQPAVAENRVFSHNILNGSIIVAGLELAAQYEQDKPLLATKENRCTVR